MVIRNNAIGNESVSSAAVSKEYNVTISSDNTEATDCLQVQGLPRLTIQVESLDNTAQIVLVTVQGAVSQEGVAGGGTPRYFSLNPQLTLAMTSGNYVFGNYDIALQYVRVNLTNSTGVSANTRVRICASQ